MPEDVEPTTVVKPHNDDEHYYEVSMTDDSTSTAEVVVRNELQHQIHKCALLAGGTILLSKEDLFSVWDN